MRKIPFLYILMVILVGASLGAIAALSKTSITNTLIETLAAITLGSAGFYYLNRETITDGALATRAIGAIGIVLVVSVWATFICVRMATFAEPELYAWDGNKGFEENVARAEIRAHAFNLGIDPDVALMRLADAGGAVDETDPATCLAGTENVRAALLGYVAVYRDLAECETGLRAVSSAANYVRYSLEGFVNEDKHDDGELLTRFAPTARSMMILADQFPQIANPLTCANPNHARTQATAARADEVARTLERCATRSIAGRLRAIRASARNYSGNWKNAAPAPVRESPLLLETLGKD